MLNKYAKYLQILLLNFFFYKIIVVLEIGLV